MVACEVGGDGVVFVDAMVVVVVADVALVIESMGGIVVIVAVVDLEKRRDHVDIAFRSLRSASNRLDAHQIVSSCHAR